LLIAQPVAGVPNANRFNWRARGVGQVPRGVRRPIAGGLDLPRNVPPRRIPRP